MLTGLLGAAAGLGAIVAGAARAAVDTLRNDMRHAQPRKRKRGGQRNPSGTRCRLKRAAANRYVYAIKGVRP